MGLRHSQYYVSAYELWLSQGHVGTVADFLADLKGEQGDGFTPKGFYNTLVLLEADVTAGTITPDMGDAYLIGTEAPYTIYIWNDDTSAWVDSGYLNGSGDVIITNYDIATAESGIAEGDTINEALGKLEYKANYHTHDDHEIHIEANTDYGVTRVRGIYATDTMLTHNVSPLANGVIAIVYED